MTTAHAKALAEIEAEKYVRQSMRKDLPLGGTPERARLDYQNGRGCMFSNGEYLDAYYHEHQTNPRNPTP